MITSIRHIVSQHDVDPRLFPKKRSMNEGAQRQGQPASRRAGISANKQRELERHLVEWLCMSYLPFSTVSNPYFRRFVEGLCPHFKIPTRISLSERHVPTLANELNGSLNEDLASATDITITADSWTSVANDILVSVTAHYLTPEFNLRYLLLQILHCDQSMFMSKRQICRNCNR